MFDGCESKEVGHQNRYGCSSPASAASAIAALQTGRRGAVTAHGNGACHQAESLWTGSVCVVPAWCCCTTRHSWCPQTSRAACRVGRSGVSDGWDARRRSTSAVQRLLENHPLGPSGLGGCAGVCWRSAWSVKLQSNAIPMETMRQIIKGISLKRWRNVLNG